MLGPPQNTPQEEKSDVLNKILRGIKKGSKRINKDIEFAVDKVCVEYSKKDKNDIVDFFEDLVFQYVFS